MKTKKQTKSNADLNTAEAVNGSQKYGVPIGLENITYEEIVKAIMQYSILKMKPRANMIMSNNSFVNEIYMRDNNTQKAVMNKLAESINDISNNDSLLPVEPDRTSTPMPDLNITMDDQSEASTIRNIENDYIDDLYDTPPSSPKDNSSKKKILLTRIHDNKFIDKWVDADDDDNGDLNKTVRKIEKKLNVAQFSEIQSESFLVDRQ